MVFTTRIGGAIHPRNDYRAFRALLDRAELRRIRLHDLRHPAASLMLAKEVPARVVMEVLGHSQISLTLNTYSYVADESMRHRGPNGWRTPCGTATTDRTSTSGARG